MGSDPIEWALKALVSAFFGYTLFRVKRNEEKVDRAVDKAELRDRIADAMGPMKVEQSHLKEDIKEIKGDIKDVKEHLINHGQVKSEIYTENHWTLNKAKDYAIFVNKVAKAIQDKDEK